MDDVDEAKEVSADEEDKSDEGKDFENMEKVQGVQEKLCFLTIHCNPSFTYIAVRDLTSSQRSAIVQSLLLTSNFLYNQ